MSRIYRLAPVAATAAALSGCCLFGGEGAAFAPGPALMPVPAPAMASASLGSETVLPLPQTTAGGGRVGLGGVVINSDGHSTFGLAALCDCALLSNPLVRYGGGLNYFFPDNGTALGGWFGGRYLLTPDAPLGVFGSASAVWSRASSDSYTVPEFSRVGGFFQESSSSQNAFGIRPAIGAEYDAGPESRFVPFAEVGYDVFLVGDDFDNEVRLSAGGSLKVGGGD